MIIIEYNNGELLKLYARDYEIYTEKNWLYVRKKLSNDHREMYRMIPITSIFEVRFD